MAIELPPPEVTEYLIGAVIATNSHPRAEALLLDMMRPDLIDRYMAHQDIGRDLATQQADTFIAECRQHPTTPAPAGESSGGK